jgi:hypothetical protein
MKVLFSAVLAAILALPSALAAQEAAASPPSQNPPAASSSNGPQQPDGKAKKGKVKTKKAKCVSPAPDSGLPDYCKNPYWPQPNTDWMYIQSNQTPGGGKG